MTVQIVSRRLASPWADPYCRATGPCCITSSAIIEATASMGRADTFGIPPASDTISGLEATANNARTSEATIPAARCA
ncbi:hypothetical protein ABZ313_39980 [Streptomyces sp. NPDC006251]|uniref:hypothetical protein n=1 Tax=Streptomyces sp. NPDC006251 TaxID=3155718 RepID=UPI0033A5C92C